MISYLKKNQKKRSCVDAVNYEQCTKKIMEEMRAWENLSWMFFFLFSMNIVKFTSSSLSLKK